MSTSDLWAKTCIGVGVLIAAVGVATSPGEPTGSVSSAEAIAAFGDIREAIVEVGVSTTFCGEWAADMQMCLDSLIAAGSDRSLGVVVTDIRADASDQSAVDIAGRYRDGTEFASVVEFVRQDGRVVAVDPVFWINRGRAVSSTAP